MEERSVTVYWRTKEESTMLRRPAPALLDFLRNAFKMMKLEVSVRTRARECEHSQEHQNRIKLFRGGNDTPAE